MDQIFARTTCCRETCPSVEPLEHNAQTLIGKNMKGRPSRAGVVCEMPTVQEEILDAFCAKLSKSASIDRATVDAIRKVVTSVKKPKADDFVAILAKDQTGGTP